MASKLFSAAFVAVATLAAASSMAQAPSPGMPDQMPPSGPRTRADVNAELMQAQQKGYSLTGSPFPPATPVAGSPRTRAEVQAELMQAQQQGYTLTGSPFPPASR